MLVRFGNPKPHQCVTVEGAHTHEASVGPAVTYINIPEAYREDGSTIYGVTCENADKTVRDIALHLAQNPDITRLPGHEAMLSICHPTGGSWQHHGAEKPSWVFSDHSELAQLLSSFYDCPILAEEDLAGVEETHHTLSGGPGVVPNAVVDATMNISQNGRDMWAQALGGGQVGLIGVGTAATTTTLTTTSTLVTNIWAGYRVYCYSTTSNNIVWGNVISNTNASNASVLTVDRWYNAATPGSTAGTTPTTPWAWVLTDGKSPAWFMGLTADTTALGSPDTHTSLASEIVTASGGLIRQICPYAHTASTNTYTLTPVFTANASDSLPVTIAHIGVFNSMVVGDTTQTMLFISALNATATLSAIGDQLSITETVSGT